MTPQTHGRGAGRSRLMEEIEKVLRRRLGWDEYQMSSKMWEYVGVYVGVLIAYGIDPHAWIEVFHSLTVNDTYMLGAVHGDAYVRPTSPSWYEVSATTSSTIGVLYFERLIRIIKTPGIDISMRRREGGRIPNMIYVKFYVLLRKGEWPWYGKGYETISSFNTSELLSYLAGLIDTDGSVRVVVEPPRKPMFMIDITSANIEFLKYLRDVVYERLGIKGHVAADKRPGSGGRLRFECSQAVQLYEELRRYLAHPMRKLRAEVYLRYYNKELTIREFEHLYEPLKYDDNGNNDPKRNHAVDALTQAAPQTHTHGG